MSCKIICLLGKSGSGKSTLQDALCKDNKYKKVISYTTRPPRPSETNMVDYYFINDIVFEIMERKNQFAEVYVAQNCQAWKYGFSKESFNVGEDNVAVVVCTPSGLKQIKEQFNNVTAFLIECSDSVRYDRIHSRENKIDEAEFERRKKQDEIDFWNIDGYIDYIAVNEDRDINDLVESIKMIVDRI